jgi:hypothetical protein
MYGLPAFNSLYTHISSARLHRTLHSTDKQEHFANSFIVIEVLPDFVEQTVFCINSFLFLISFDLFVNFNLEEGARSRS